MLAFTLFVLQVTRMFFPSHLSPLVFFDTFARLKPLDIEIMKRLGTRVNLIPVVAKADTLTQNDLFVFKQRVRGKFPSSHSLKLNPVLHLPFLFFIFLLF